LSNSQSWNRYAYVLDSPLALVDPSGLVGLVPLGCMPVYPIPGRPGMIVCPPEGGGAGGNAPHYTCTGFISLPCGPTGPPPPPIKDVPPRLHYKTFKECKDEAWQKYNQVIDPLTKEATKGLERDMVENAIAGCALGWETGCIPGAAAGVVTTIVWDAGNHAW